MAVFVETTLPSGKRIRVEAGPSSVTIEPGLKDVSTPGAVIEKVENAFQEGLGLIDEVASAVYHRLAMLAETVKPKEVSVEFGVKFGGEAGVVLAKASTEASLQVTIKWEAAMKS
jgi:NTP-dependent ternary system trypsin peptidase co-occuring protein